MSEPESGYDSAHSSHRRMPKYDNRLDFGQLLGLLPAAAMVGGVWLALRNDVDTVRSQNLVQNERVSTVQAKQAETDRDAEKRDAEQKAVLSDIRSEVRSVAQSVQTIQLQLAQQRPPGK